MLRCVALVRTDISEVRIASIMRVTRIGVRHSHLRENLKSYIALTGWPLAEK
jgi:hypothetical protein